MAYDDKDWEVAVFLNYANLINAVTAVAFRAEAVEDGANVAAQVYSGWGVTGGLLSIMNNQVETVEVKATRLDMAVMPTIVGSADLDGEVAGAESAEIVEPATCFVMSLYSGAPGRANRGRVYVPFVAENHVSSPRATWGTGDPDLFRGVPDAWFNAIGSADVVSGILAINSRSQTALIPVDHVTPRTYFGTQRRRAEQAE
jgi:hypothetical protein